MTRWSHRQVAALAFAATMILVVAVQLKVSSNALPPARQSLDAIAIMHVQIQIEDIPHSNTSSLNHSSSSLLVVGSKIPTTHRRPRPPLSTNTSTTSTSTPPDCLVFFHVPKTAGTSFRHFLHDLSKDLQWKFRMWYSPKPGLPKHVKRHQVVHVGHVTASFPTATHMQHCLRITVLREPMQRVASLYRFLLRHSPAGSMAWEPCLNQQNRSSCHAWHQFQNEVTRLFSVSDVQLWNAVTAEPRYTEQPLIDITVAAAMKTLCGMHFVCFMDRLAECERAVRRLVGRNVSTVGGAGNESVIPKLNADRSSRSGANVSTERLAQAQAANLLDIQLYDWARRTFLDQSL